MMSECHKGKKLNIYILEDYIKLVFTNFMFQYALSGTHTLYGEGHWIDWFPASFPDVIKYAMTQGM